MTKHVCPRCGYGYDDQTGEVDDQLVKLKGYKETAAPVFKELDKLRGYRPPKRAAEAASIMRMLKKYTLEQIIDTWKKLKSDKYYKDKELYMMTVECQIGAMISGTLIRVDKFANQKYGNAVRT